MGALFLIAGIAPVCGQEVLTEEQILERAAGLPPLPLEPQAASSWAAEEAFPLLRFDQPLYFCVAPRNDRWAYVVERSGTIQRFRNDTDAADTEVVLDISDTVENKQGTNGLLGLAFHPQFNHRDSPNRGYFYVFYTTVIGGVVYDRLSRFTVDDKSGLAQRRSEQVLIQQYDRDGLHNGGSLHFGPDGFLYLSLGDEGQQLDHFASGQKIDENLFSGVLRIDVDCQGGPISHKPLRQPRNGQTANYYIPSDNPFVGVSHVLEEFWAIGFRSPHRMSFDALTGRLWLGDVGFATWETIELVGRGTNHRWSYREGFSRLDGSYLQGRRPDPYYGVETWPVYQYQHLEANHCIIGGYIYRGKKLPQLQGKYVFGDSVSHRIWAMELDENNRPSRLELLLQLPESQRLILSSFGVDQNHEIYLCLLGAGERYNGLILRLSDGRK